MSRSVASIFPWDGLEDGRREWFQAVPRAWPHYQQLNIEIAIEMTMSRTVTFEAVPENEEEDLPALPEETRTETHTASLTGTFLWERLTRADEFFFSQTSETLPTGKFWMASQLGGWFGNTPIPAECKVTHSTICGTSNTLTGGTCSQTTWSRSLDPVTYGEITSTTTDGTLEATWYEDQYGIAEHWIGQDGTSNRWEWSFSSSGGGSGTINLTSDGPGLPYTLPALDGPYHSFHATPPAGTPITLTTSGTTTDPEDYPGDYHGSADYTVTFTMSGPP